MCDAVSETVSTLNYYTECFMIIVFSAVKLLKFGQNSTFG